MTKAKNPEVSILVCTLNDRIAMVPDILLPEMQDVRYVLSFQYTDAMFLSMIPEVLRERRDVILIPFPATGLSANRNNALQHCATPIAIIADDDFRLSLDNIRYVQSLFSKDDDLDIVVFAHNKLAVRLSLRIPAFDTRFGLGSAYLSCGEEEVFLHQAKTFGLKLCFEQRDLCNCPDAVSPWKRFSLDKRVRRSWGALQYMQHSTIVAFCRIVVRAITYRIPSFDENVHSKRKRRLLRWQFLCDMFDGLYYIIKHPLNESVAEEIPLDFQPIDIWRLP